MAKKGFQGFHFEGAPGESLVHSLEEVFSYVACVTDCYRYERALGIAEEPPPEKALLIAVLLQAKKDMVSPSSAVREDARQWILARNRSDFYGFIPLCRFLQLDPDRVRAQFLDDARNNNPGGHIHLHSGLKFESRSVNSGGVRMVA